MPPKNNIKFGDGSFYLMGVDESLHPLGMTDAVDDISETEWADEAKYLSIRDSMEATFECEWQPSREWVLVYCRECRSPFPITMWHELLHGREGWRCPLCTAIKRAREKY